MCFAVIAHHVPHTTVPANRPHRPVSAPPQRSPLAETGQPVRTQYGVRGRRLVRRLHPCARADRPPFKARPKWSSALNRWAMQKCAVPSRGTAGKGPTVQRKRSPRREEGCAKVSAEPARLGLSRSGSAPRRKSRASSILHQICAGRTGKQVDKQTGRIVGMRAVGSSSPVPTRATARCLLAVEPAMRTGSRAGIQPVTYAGMQTCKPSCGPEGRRPRLWLRLRTAPTPRRSIRAVEFLRKHAGAGSELQPKAHAI